MAKSTNSIKGLTVELGFDTSKVTRTLGDIKKASSDLSKELSQINSLLKLDPKNVELLSQKQKLLNQQVDEGKRNLDGLRKTLNDVESGKIKLTEEQTRDLSREVIRTEENLKKATKELKNFGDVGQQQMKSLGQEVSSVGDKVSNFGKSFAPVSIASAAVITGSMAAFEEVEDAFDIIVKKTGAVSDEAILLEQIYRNVAGSMSVEFDDVGTAIGEINTRFEFTDDLLKTSTEDFLKFARVNDVDVNTAVQKVARMMGDASIPAEQYNEVLDALTVASQKSGISIDVLAESMTKYGAPMRALGYDTKESMALFASWEKAGVTTEIAFSGMKKAIGNFSAQGKDAKVEFAKMVEEIKGSKDIAEATAIAIDVFGQKAGPDLADAILNGRFEFEGMLEVLENSDGTLSTVYDSLLDGADDAQISMNNLKLGGDSLGKVLMKALAPVFQKISVAIKKVVAWFEKLDPGIQQAIAVVLLLTAVLTPIIIVIGALISGVGAIIGGFSAFAGAIGAVLTFLGPLGLLIAAIVLVVINLWNNCEWFRNFFIGMWDGLILVVQGFWNGIVLIFSTVGEWLSINIIQPITIGFITMINNIIGFFEGFINGLIGGVEGFVNFFINGLNQVISAANAVAAITGFQFELIPNLKLGRIALPRFEIPQFRTGGILEDGMAMMAEAGSPELLTMINGKAHVQPLTNNERAQILGKDKSSNVSVNFYGDMKFNKRADVEYFSNRLAYKLKGTGKWKKPKLSTT